MSALTQYISLFCDNRATIEKDTSDILKELHERALQALDGATLPTKRTEGFEKTSVDEMFSPDFGVNINRLPFPADIARTFRCDVPNLSTLLGVVINDIFTPTNTLLKKLDHGATVCSLAKAAKDKPELVRKYLGSTAPLSDPGVALNSLLLQDGVFIHIPAGAVIRQPIQIVNIFSAPASMLAVRRVVIALEEGAQCSVLLCDHTQNKENNYLSSEVIEVVAGRDSRLDLVSLEESSERTARYSILYARQEDGSDLNINTTTIFNGKTRNNFNVDIAGEHAHSELTGMVIADGNRHVDNYSNVSHNAPRSKSEQLFKYLLDNDATGAFEGGIYVSRNAPYSEGYQSNRNIIASQGARMYSKPQLLIYNDEVKCNHGSATGQLDANQLFYMQTRGIPLATAKQLLMQAFMTDAIAHIRIDAIRTRLAMLIEKRLSGENATCSYNCASGCQTN